MINCFINIVTDCDYQPITNQLNQPIAECLAIDRIGFRIVLSKRYLCRPRIFISFSLMQTMKMLWFLQDVHNFLNQFLPSPSALFLRYRFSPADLADLSPKRHIKARSDKELSTTESAVETADLSILGTFSFDVLSYNINDAASSKPDRVRLILRAIFSSGANIILLQETNTDWEKLLLEDAIALQYNHRYFHHPFKGDKHRPPDRAAGGIAILSLYPLKDISVIDLTQDVSGSVFPALICKAMLPLSVIIQNDDFVNDFPNLSNESNVPIGIANVHLRPPLNLDGSAWFDTARKTEPIRLAEVKDLVRRTMPIDSSLDHSLNLQPELDIIAGDFNEDNAGAALSYLSSLRYVDALQQFVPRRKETHTWPFLRNTWTLKKRLDHILWRNDVLSIVSKDGTTRKLFRLKCLGCGVLTGYEAGASDHQPVLSRFGIVRD